VERVHVLDVMRRRGKARPRLAPHHEMFDPVCLAERGLWRSPVRAQDNIPGQKR
jgi:hypothetical protein